MMTQGNVILVNLNGKERPVPAGCTIAGLLKELDLGNRRVAVMRNEDIVSRGDLESAVLVEGDVLEIVTLVGGG